MSKSRAPRAGDEILYRGKPIGIAVRVEGNLCWTKYYDQNETLPFIWMFKDGLNNLHDWPGKEAA